MRPLLLIPLLFVSCMKTEVINEHHLGLIDTTEIVSRKDTVTKRPPKPPKPPTPPADTTESERVPMGWNPTVEDWESADTTNIEI